jgi:hypothetical protein
LNEAVGVMKILDVAGEKEYPPGKKIYLINKKPGGHNELVYNYSN